jgi:hypothetical protein
VNLTRTVLGGLAGPIVAALVAGATPARADLAQAESAYRTAYGRWEQANGERLDAAREADDAYLERSRAEQEHAKAERDVEKAQRDLDGARQVEQRFRGGQNPDAYRDAIETTGRADRELRDRTARARDAKARRDRARDAYERRDDRLSDKEQAEKARRRELEDAARALDRARAAAPPAPQAGAPTSPPASPPATPPLSPDDPEPARQALERAVSGRTDGLDQLGRLSPLLRRVASGPGGPSTAQDCQEARARFEAGIGTLRAALREAAAVADLGLPGPASPAMGDLARQAQSLADRIAQDIRSAEYKWHQWWAAHCGAPADALPQVEAPPVTGPPADPEGSRVRVAPKPPRSPEELVAGDPPAPGSPGPAATSTPAAPPAGPTVQFLTPGLQPIGEVTKYAPFFVQVTLPAADAPAGPIDVTLRTPYWLWRGRHTVTLERQGASGGAVTYRSRLQYWEKESGWANVFEVGGDFLDSAGALLFGWAGVTDDPDWVDDAPLYQVLAIDNGQTLQAEYGGSTAQVTVYNTWVQQSIARTAAGFEVAQGFYAWLGDQLRAAPGGATIDPAGLQALKDAFPPGFVPWELTVLGAGGEIGAEQVEALRRSAEQKLSLLPQVRASAAGLPAGDDIQRAFIGAGFLQTLLSDPGGWTVYTGTGHIERASHAFPLPTAFNLAADHAVTQARDVNRQGAQAALGDTLMRGYTLYAGFSGGGALWTLGSTYVATAGQFGSAVIDGQGTIGFVPGTTALGHQASRWDVFVSSVEVFGGPIVAAKLGQVVGGEMAEGKRALAQDRAQRAGRIQLDTDWSFGMPGGHVGLGPSGRNVAARGGVRNLTPAQSTAVVKRVQPVDPAGRMGVYDGDDWTGLDPLQFSPADGDFFLQNGLVPRFTISADGKKFHVTDMFSGPQGRRARIAFVESPDGSVETVTWYQSNSEGTWRAALGAKDKGFIMKGPQTDQNVNERAADLAAPIQTELNARGAEPMLSGLSIETRMKAFYSRVPYAEFLPTPQGGSVRSIAGFTDPAAISIPLVGADGSIPGGFLPDLSRGPTYSWPIIDSPLYGQGHGFAIATRDGKSVIHYHVTQQGDWVQGVYDAGGGLTPYGTYRSVYQYPGSTPIRYTRSGENATIPGGYVKDPAYVGTDPLLPHVRDLPGPALGGTSRAPVPATDPASLTPVGVHPGTLGSPGIVGFRPGARPFSTLATYDLSGLVLFSLDSTMLYVPAMSPEQALRLGGDPSVAYVEPVRSRGAEAGPGAGEAGP